MIRMFLLPALFVFHAFFSAGQAVSHSFGPGFDAAECDELLQLNTAFLDTTGQADFHDLAPGYRPDYRSASLGLDNAWMLWVRADSTVVILLRGTTADPRSLLADFLCAMSPAKGRVVLGPSDTVSYHLADLDRAAVHTGFLIGFAYLSREMRMRTDSLYARGYRNFLVAGHSQGGALCYYVSSWLYYLERDGVYPGIRVKTYASAAPKMCNMYFAYDYEHIMREGWAYSVVNSADPVPEMPFTTQQPEVDINQPSPVVMMQKRIGRLPFFERMVVKRAFNKMQKGAVRSSLAYQKYLGGYTGKFITDMMPGLAIPEQVNTTYFVRTGVPVSLIVNDAYRNYFRKLSEQGPYYHHNPLTYRFLLREYYEGLPEMRDEE